MVGYPLFLQAGVACSVRGNPAPVHDSILAHQFVRAGLGRRGWAGSATLGCIQHPQASLPTQLLLGTLRRRCSPKRSASLSQPRCPACVPTFPIPTMLGSGRRGSMRCTALTLVCLPPEYIGALRE